MENPIEMDDLGVPKFRKHPPEQCDEKQQVVTMFFLNVYRYTPAAGFKHKLCWQLQVLTWDVLLLYYKYLLKHSVNYNHSQQKTSILLSSNNETGGLTKSNQQNCDNSKNHSGNKQAL